MISDRIIGNCIEEACAITGAGFAAIHPDGSVIASAGNLGSFDTEAVSFAESSDDMARTGGHLFIRIKDGDDTALILVTADTEEVSARLVASQLKNLIIAYNDRTDRNSYFRDLLLDNMLHVDMYRLAEKLHIEPAVRRCVFVIEPVVHKDNSLMEMVKELFYSEAGDHVTSVDENRIIVIKALDQNDGPEDLEESARMLVDMAESEAMCDVRVAYGTVAEDIGGVTASYREARMALEVSKIFYPLKRTIEYGNLGVGRLIYQLPEDLCRVFVKEIFGDSVPEEIDEEILSTVDKFFENNLNVSETSRQLYIHRNTLIYRIEKIQKATGLDVRVFDDALTLKIALMVVGYMRYIRKSE
ncbi:MAG: helix-turn-helix domain-containing protein [Lachnospiraceae bacterium]|nr:helix-turn-helix domain-containing protein [Lachnospiraceae bacterium]